MDKTLRHNFTVNVLDGTFFGFALGFASLVTVVPLFVASLTDSTILIGLVGALEYIGWQMPQLLTVNMVTGLRRYKPTVLLLTLVERVPFIGLTVVALLIPTLGAEVGLVIAYLLILMHTFGGGITATTWQTMLIKVIPDRIRGTFYGVQSSAANLTSGIGAVSAGFILQRLPSPIDFALCFLLAGVAMVVSWVFLALNREQEQEPLSRSQNWGTFWRTVGAILHQDVNLRWFILARIFAQLNIMALAFYTIYAVRTFDMDEQTAGFMAGVLTLAQVVGNPLVGWLGDRWSHRQVFAISLLIGAVGTAMALIAPSLSWFYVIFALAGVTRAGLWTSIISLTAELGIGATKPYYIGMTNTLIGPTGVAIPLLGGVLADSLGFSATFAAATIGGLFGAGVLLLIMREPRYHKTEIALPGVAPAGAD